MINFCTLFDSNYLDKFLAMYESLVRVKADFTVYVMCFDERAHAVLSTMKLERITVNTVSELEERYPELSDLKKVRSKAEYCWTCTAASIEFFLDTYHLADCTYIDADLYFYHDPAVLFEEIAISGSDVAIMEHRYNADAKDTETSGKYCVEFNFFKNSEGAREVLSWWKERCFEWCYQKFEPATEAHMARYGDQKYLEMFSVLFQEVHVVGHLGAGVAPWNFKQYRLASEGGDICLKHLPTGKEIPLIFYHFQNYKYISEKTVNINSQCRDKKVKYAVYYPYICHLSRVRAMLREQYGLDISTRKSYSSNKLKAFIQRYIMPFRVRTLSDVVHIKKAIKATQNAGITE